MGKDERALSVSGYVFRGEVKYTEYAYTKVSPYKRRTKNHLVDQIESFRMGDKDSRRDDDLHFVMGSRFRSATVMVSDECPLDRTDGFACAL
jgi:hypothetical protein